VHLCFHLVGLAVLEFMRDVKFVGLSVLSSSWDVNDSLGG